MNVVRLGYSFDVTSLIFVFRPGKMRHKLSRVNAGLPIKYIPLSAISKGKQKALDARSSPPDFSKPSIWPCKRIPIPLRRAVFRNLVCTRIRPSAPLP
ncbi:hypothetical protein A0H81_10101 [Grifola frondosa]|uniref:Uncharacterized protein n=1 Tax=Grifola frondosa TaxID=5627 RepID=A0A1C7LXP6_GRIFR|nr:hypothetical protein A0H81_10101 [Grifola frondosa]